MPYSKLGDWETGAGFELIAHWCFDWIVLTWIAADAGAEQEFRS